MKNLFENDRTSGFPVLLQDYSVVATKNNTYHAEKELQQQFRDKNITHGIMVQWSEFGVAEHSKTQTFKMNVYVLIKDEATAMLLQKALNC